MINVIRYNDIIKNKFLLSPHQLQLMEYSNKNSFRLESLLSRKIDNRDNGIDIGSNNYMPNSEYKFLKTRIANENSFIADLSSNESFEFMNRHAFVNQNLKLGDILISKDSNIGECCILDNDYPNCMIASAFYKLPLKNNKYYIFSFLKTKYFKNQLDLIIPRGATIRHAGKKFLDCLVPFPNGKDSIKIISKIESITKDIIDKEMQIKENENIIYELIEKELSSHSSVSNYYLPKYDEIYTNNRIDAGYYCEKFKKIKSLIKNYQGGYSNLNDFGYTISRGQNLQVSCIGKSIESNDYHDGFYKIAKPTNLSDYGTVISYNYLGNKNNLSLLKKGDIVFSAEGTIGKCAMFSDIDSEKIITNIHGIILNKLNHDIIESGFVCCFLRYLRKAGYFEYLSVGGQGGSLAMKYWDDVILPKFPKELMKKISELYCDVDSQKTINIINLSNEIKLLKDSLNDIFGLIISKEYINYNEIIDIINKHTF